MVGGGSHFADAELMYKDKKLTQRFVLRALENPNCTNPTKLVWCENCTGSLLEALVGNGFQLVRLPKNEPAGLAHLFGIPANQVVRTEKVRSDAPTLSNVPSKWNFHTWMPTAKQESKLT
jgi:hypothetical protein